MTEKKQPQPIDIRENPRSIPQIAGDLLNTDLLKQFVNDVNGQHQLFKNLDYKRMLNIAKEAAANAVPKSVVVHTGDKIGATTSTSQQQQSTPPPLEFAKEYKTIHFEAILEPGDIIMISKAAQYPIAFLAALKRAKIVPLILKEEARSSSSRNNSTRKSSSPSFTSDTTPVPSIEILLEKLHNSPKLYQKEMEEVIFVCTSILQLSRQVLASINKK